MKKKKVLNYQDITFQQIKKVVKIKKKDNNSKFTNWFAFTYKVSESERQLFEKLITKNKLFLQSYNETKLLVSFIGPILYQIDFNFDDIKDWYDSWLSGEVNGIRFNGRPDFMVAKGDVVPEKTYFFISEFKRSIPNNNPEYQLLAEMLVAMEINSAKIFHGCFIIGQNWFFVILEKLEDGSYEYFVSELFDCLKIENLQQIYINLQAAKALFCKD